MMIFQAASELITTLRGHKLINGAVLPQSKCEPRLEYACRRCHPKVRAALRAPVMHALSSCGACTFFISAWYDDP